MFSVNEALLRVEWVPSVGRSEEVSRSSDFFHEGAVRCLGFGQDGRRKLVSAIARDCGGDVMEFSARVCFSKTPSTLVVAPISFFCPCCRGADHTRSLALWNLLKGEVWGVAFAPVSE